MDPSTALGLVLMNGLIVAAIWLGGVPFGAYIDPPSVLIVCGGTVGAILAAFPVADVKQALLAGRTTLQPTPVDPTAAVALRNSCCTKADSADCECAE